MRFSRFLATAFEQFFFEMAMPSLACVSPLRRNSTVKHRSLLRRGFANTWLNAALLGRRRSLPNENRGDRDARSEWLLVALAGLRTITV